MLNRLDLALLVGPALMVEAWRMGRSAWRPMAIGMLPLVAWEAFSMFYYASLVPNTAYAKLNIDTPLAELTGRGLSYLRRTAEADPATIPVMLLAADGGTHGESPNQLAARGWCGPHRALPVPHRRRFHDGALPDGAIRDERRDPRPLAVAARAARGGDHRGGAGGAWTGGAVGACGAQRIRLRASRQFAARPVGRHAARRRELDHPGRHHR